MSSDIQARDEVRGEPRREGGRRYVVFSAVAVAFSVWHLLAIASCLGPDSYLLTKINPLVRPYLLALKVDQNWSMFAPEPLAEDRRIIAEITMADGTMIRKDMTTSVNESMRSLNSASIGKLLKAHDKLLGGANSGFVGAYAHHICWNVTRSEASKPKSIRLQREGEAYHLDPITMMLSKDSTHSAIMGTYDCP
jgi:hypothetical protein